VRSERSATLAACYDIRLLSLTSVYMVRSVRVPDF
jgi:hypothetical protein